MQTVSTSTTIGMQTVFHDDGDAIRPCKKVKLEHEEADDENAALRGGFLSNPLPPAPDHDHDHDHEQQQRSIVCVPQPALAYLNNNSRPVMCIRQFWKAGDYEPVAPDHHSALHLPAAGVDHVRVHPRFLHSNATSHKWALGAFAELLDNALDEVRTGATYVNVDVLHNDRDPCSKMLLVEDNGGGMSPDKLRGCMSLGYSEKSKLANTIGQYGNGFKTSSMRLGADVIVFTRHQGQDGSSPTQSVGMLSYTYLMETRKEDIVVPMIDFEKKGEEWGMLLRYSLADWERNLETIVHWSPYSSEEHLLKQFDYIKDQGTRIIIYNLWEDEEGQLELDFDTDKDDIQIRGVNRDPKKIEMAKDYPNSRFFLTYRHSLRSYAAILYLNIPDGFRIILRGKDVNHHSIIDDMMLTQKLLYKPTADATIRNDQNMRTEVTIGFVKDAKHHIDVQGFNVYHKNRLIKPFWRVWNAAGSDGRGVIGVLEADFVEPAHDKQEFERTSVLSRLENRLIVIQKKYWSTNCQEIGYAKRVKNASAAKCKPSMGDSPGVSTRTDYNNATRVTFSPVVKHEPLNSVDSAQLNEAYTCTVRESPCNPSISLKEPNASTSNLTSEAMARNGNGDGGYNGYIIARLRKENLELRQRLESREGAVFNNLLLDLQSERDKNVVLEQQVLKAQEIIEKLDQEQGTLIDVFSEERQRRDEMEETLRKKWKEAMDTIEELKGQIKGGVKQECD